MINDKLTTIRSIFFATLTGFFYVMAFHSLFVQSNILVAMLFFLLLFIVIHFFFVEIYKYPLRYLFLSLATLSIVRILLGGDSSIQMAISVVILHLSIFMLGWYLKNNLNNKVSFNSFSYVTSGGYIFTVFVTVGFGLATIGLFNKFPFSCEGLSKQSSTVVDTVTRPFKLGLDQAANIKNQAELFFGFKVGDIVNLNKQLPASSEAGVLGLLSTRLVKQVQEENVSASTGICDYLLGKVNEKFGLPEYRVSLVLLIFLLLYPFIRLVFRVMSFIAFVLFKILYRAGVYRVKTETNVVEKIE